MISIIVAIAENGAIGKNNDLLWHIPEDLKRFKQITTGHTVVMGKRTWESLPKHPLPGRRNIVITDDPGDHFIGALAAFSIHDALNKCGSQEEIFIIGGASVYSQFLPVCDRLYLTKIHKSFDGDVFFHELDMNQWKLISSEKYPQDGRNDFSYTHFILDRKKS